MFTSLYLCMCSRKAGKAFSEVVYQDQKHYTREVLKCYGLIATYYVNVYLICKHAAINVVTILVQVKSLNSLASLVQLPFSYTINQSMQVCITL